MWDVKLPLHKSTAHAASGRYKASHKHGMEAYSLIENATKDISLRKRVYASPGTCKHSWAFRSHLWVSQHDKTPCSRPKPHPTTPNPVQNLPGSGAHQAVAATLSGSARSMAFASSGQGSAVPKTLGGVTFIGLHVAGFPPTVTCWQDLL